MSKATEPGPEVPASTMPYPPLHTDKKFVVLSDWLVQFHGSSSRHRFSSSSVTPCRTVG